MAGLEVDIKYFKVPSIEDEGVNVGWFSDQKYDNNTSIAQVARWNEFGTKAGVPQRPFMRVTSMQKEQKWIEELRTMVQKAIDSGKAVNIDKELKKFGEIVAGDVQATILSGNFTPNSPATRKRKGEGSIPLVDTAIMVSSIQARTDRELLDV